MNVRVFVKFLFSKKLNCSSNEQIIELKTSPIRTPRKIEQPPLEQSPIRTPFQLEDFSNLNTSPF